jgi:hypothetical protein
MYVWKESGLYRENGRPARSPRLTIRYRQGQKMFGIIDDARAEALFVTDLQRSECPTTDQIRCAVRGAIRQHGGSRNCAALVAHEFGEHPETAVPRMRWARQAVRDAYPRSTQNTTLTCGAA